MKRAAILLLLPLLAAVQIHTVYYDPIDHQRGGEFILLENTADHPISVEEWRVATTVSEQDLTLTGSIGARSYYLAADEGWDELKDDASWPDPDHEQRMTLANNDGFVQLINQEDEVLSTVGWGDPERSEETPHPGAPKGEALTRINQTGDNQHDFLATTPVFPQQSKPTNTTISVNVTNEQPRIRSYELPDDNPATNQAQLNPLTRSRNVTLRVEVEDNNTVQGLVVTANGQEMQTNQTGTRANYTTQLTLQPGDTHIHLVATNNQVSDKKSIELAFTNQNTIHIPQNIQLTVKPGGVATTYVPVKNTGEQPIDLRIKGTAPHWAQQHLSNVTYSIQGDEYPLENAFRVHSIALHPNETYEVQLHVQANHLPAQVYAGQLLIAATPSR